MQTILVSIISDQTVPNYLFIKEFQQQVDRFLFISTEQMEQKGKTDIICNTAQIDKNKRLKVLVSDNLLHEVHQRLNKLNFSHDAQFLVNLTGGTKMMSIAVWRFFHQFSNARFFYVPIHTNAYVEVFDDKPSVTTPFNYKISVEEYLNIYSIRFEKSEIIFNEKLVYDVFNDVKSCRFELEKFPRNKLKKNNIQHNIQQIHTKWFEEYVYFRIKKELNLSDKEILTGIKLYDLKQEKENPTYQNDNETDVIFIYNNKPYIIECKFGVGKEKINTQNLNQIIYKLSSLNKRFGLSARSTIFTLSDFNSMADGAAENLKRRCEIAGVYYPMFDRRQILSKDFNSLLNNFVVK